MSLRALFLGVAACGTPDFDGHYRVASNRFDALSCDGPGDDVTLEYATFEIRNRSFFGVTIYPVYRCDDTGVCAADNEAEWNVVVIEDDLDQVGFEFTLSIGDSCVLHSIDHVIESTADGVVLQNRDYQLVTEPYDPTTCTPETAKDRRGDMHCVSVLELVGTRMP